MKKYQWMILGAAMVMVVLGAAHLIVNTKWPEVLRSLHG